ncbi:sarcosine oxidase subunit gamma [Acidocella sp.]|uniref:sarcosine oxidase subunit gamma n=1 Tax=Acidocella sp. TaxID=50710 RepID=UPI003CFD9EF1
MLDAAIPAFAPHPFIGVAPWRRIRSLAVYKTTRPALEAALGVVLPATPKRLSLGDADILWNGPGQWLVLGELDMPETLAAVTEQTDGLCLLTLSGPHAVEVLKRLLPIDIACFAEDDVAITTAAHIGVRVWREGAVFNLACFRSFAGALHHALAQAAQSFPGRG